MDWLIVKNDFKRNKVINLALLLFMMFSACLAVLSVIIAVQTFTSISNLYETAQPPHFLQMHKGELDQAKIDTFMKSNKSVTYWQTDTMIDIFGDNLSVVSNNNTYKLSDCRLDIGLVKQNKEKDLLLNSRHQKVIMQEGEIGIPVLLKEKYGMKIGDQVILNVDDVKRKFVIKEFVLDSQMNSPMCSSTRILLSDKDFDSLDGKIGEKEYLIEAYLTNSKEASTFRSDYENSGMPQYGQAVTYANIFLISAFTDITTVFVFLLVSILLIIISFICVKFTIMAALEEDVGEIGTMKAIGLPFSEIRNLYMVKYRALAAVGVIIGYVLAVMLNGAFTRHIKATFGDMDISALAVILSIAIGCMVFLLINRYCKKVLKIIKKVTVVDAMVNGKGFEKSKGRVKDGLYKSKKLSVNWLMATREVFHKFRKWTIVFAIAAIAVLMIMIPANLVITFESPEFVTYMGSSMDDIMIEVENGENLETSYLQAKQVVKEDDAVKSSREYRRVCVQTTNNEGKRMNLHIDCGDNEGNGLKYLDGKAPEETNEIAISYNNANEMGKDVGSKIVLLYNNKEQEFIVSGIYQDVTSGGYTAKSKYKFGELTAEKYGFLISLYDKQEAEVKAEKWSGILGKGVTVDPMKEFGKQTMGGVAKQLKTVVLVIVIIASCLAMLITVLFLKLRIAKDLADIAVLKAIGFTEHDIRQQYLIKMGCISFAGIATGIILTDILGEKIISLALSMAGLGLKSVNFITNPLIEYIICPLFLLALMLLVTRIVMNITRKYNIISIINE